ncbi:GNAT family N-acetyltransferase [Paenibacillus sp. 481]|uniref:GNAT family N-acetyltransferase n=1 Tax=Paenibacillus sp. 481 TaxID=2835869 RepID=UPI001E529EEB|nr:GNAT family N-acetyltransferase [Paenibacillus sp. 481]UHA73226.1 N-acetyltransferase [Paenibacillus sp. 481]
MEYVVRNMTKDDWEQVKSIYEAGIATGNATLETQAPTYEKWIASAHAECCYVVEDGSHIVGWCKIGPVSTRHVYAGVGEVSIYVHPDAKGKGIGNLLLHALIEGSEQQGFWTLQAGIFPENSSSIHLHKKHGFRELGTRERIGKRNGVWHDVLLLERRSSVVGID